MSQKNHHVITRTVKYIRELYKGYTPPNFIVGQCEMQVHVEFDKKSYY